MEVQRNQGSKDGVPRERTRRRATEERKKRADDRLSAFILPPRRRVIRALVNSRLFLYNLPHQCFPLGKYKIKLQKQQVQTLQVMRLCILVYIKESPATWTSTSMPIIPKWPQCTGPFPIDYCVNSTAANGLTWRGGDHVRARDGWTQQLGADPRLSRGEPHLALLVDFCRDLLQAVQGVRVGLLRLDHRLAQRLHLTLDLLWITCDGRSTSGSVNRPA